MPKLELSEDEKRVLLENSIERVINTARTVALHSTHEDAGMSYDDMGFVKPVMDKLWNWARNEAFIQNAKHPDGSRMFNDEGRYLIQVRESDGESDP